MKGKQGVSRCATHSSPSDPLTTARRKTLPPDHQRKTKRGGLTLRSPLSGTFLTGAIV